MSRNIVVSETTMSTKASKSKTKTTAASLLSRSISKESYARLNSDGVEGKQQFKAQTFSMIQNHLIGYGWFLSKPLSNQHNSPRTGLNKVWHSYIS